MERALEERRAWSERKEKGGKGQEGTELAEEKVVTLPEEEKKL